MRKRIVFYFAFCTCLNAWTCGEMLETMFAHNSSFALLVAISAFIAMLFSYRLFLMSLEEEE